MAGEVEVIPPAKTYADQLTQKLNAPRIDPVYLTIANDYLSGMSTEDIAYEYNLKQDVVVATLEKTEVKQYIDSVYMSQGYLHRVKRAQLINKVIEAKLEEAMESGKFTSKDLLEWLKFAREEEQGTKPKGPGIAIQVNNYDRLMSDILGE